MNEFLHQLLAGLATGGIYASVALALVMIYQATHQINFAQGEMAMFSTFIAWTLIQAGWPYWAAFFATVAIAFVMGAAIEALLIRRLRNAPILAIVVVFVALLVILHSLAGWLFGYTIRAFPSPFADTRVAGGLLSPHQQRLDRRTERERDRDGGEERCPVRPTRPDQQRGDEGGEHRHLALREVHQVRGLVDHHQRERQAGVDAAGRQASQQLGHESVHSAVPPPR